MVPLYSWNKCGTPGLIPKPKIGLIYFPSVWLLGPDELTKSINEGKVERVEIENMGEKKKSDVQVNHL